MMIASRFHLPRPSRSRFIFWASVLILLNLCWVIFAVTAYFERLDRYKQFMSEGRTVTATITGLEDWTDFNGLSYYRVHYRFIADVNGQPTMVNAQEYISHALYSSLKDSQTIEVVYDVSDPDISTLKSENEAPSVLIPVILIAGALTVSAVFIYFDYRERSTSSKKNRTRIGNSSPKL